MARFRRVGLDTGLLGRPVSAPPRLCRTSSSGSGSSLSGCRRGARRGLGLGRRGASRRRRVPRGVSVQSGFGYTDRCHGEPGVRVEEQRFQGASREGSGLLFGR